MQPQLSQFNNLNWYRVKVILHNIRHGPIVRKHIIIAIESIIKGATTRLLQTASASFQLPKPIIFFHITNKHHKYRVYQDSLVPLEIFFCQTSKDITQQWLDCLQKHLSDEETGKNFNIANISEIEERNFYKVCAEIGINNMQDIANLGKGEVCLEFLIPLPFPLRKKKEKTFINKDTLINSLEERFAVLFGQQIKYQSANDNFTILPYYWYYTQIPNPKPEINSIHYINGCCGNLYLKGSFADFLLFLILGNELHAGSKISFSQGYYRLHLSSLKYFDRYFPNKSAIVATIYNVIDKYDSAIESLSIEKPPFNQENYAENLMNEIKENRYQPCPNTAFIIKKKGAGERLVEQLSFKDLIVQQYLLKTISPIFERFFEPESIGYRKGVSRETAIATVQSAIAQGYQYVIESDIEDFFPSIDLEILSRLLDFYLPKNDTIIRDLLLKSIRNGYVLNGRFHNRTKGLAQGSPLSPILANLYLDSFDEKIKQWNVKLIRYADDFIVLTKTKSDAENILSQTETYLSELGLKLNKAKTAIKPIQQGFSFLGIRFERSEIKVEPEAEFRRLKKPLYITEPYYFLSINGDAVNIIKDRVVVETIPLRRISEIMVMEKSVFSTALVRKCTDYNIPITITLNTGYYITTIKPDSKNYYDIAFEHAKRYYALTDTEYLCLAKEFASNKIKNYLPLFRQKYEPGLNVFIKELEITIQKIYEASDINVVRGLEGSTAKKIYEKLNNFIDHEAFHIRKRERQNPDRINSLLNFGYYLLFSKINACLRAIGLNPYLGFLHSPSDNYESLACDIQDLFRSRIDRFIIRLINLKVITKEDFSETPSGMYLKREAIKKFINQLEAEMERKNTKNELSLKESIYVQAMIIKKWVLENSSFTFYTWKYE